MPTYYSDQWRQSDAGAWHPIVQRRDHVGLFQVTARFDGVTADQTLLLDDVLKLCPVQAGLRVKEVVLGSTGIDPGAGMQVDIGDAAVSDRYISGTTIVRGGGVARMSNQAGVDYRYTADDSVDLLVTAAPTVPLAGIVELVVLLAADDLG